MQMTSVEQAKCSFLPPGWLAPGDTTHGEDSPKPVAAAHFRQATAIFNEGDMSSFFYRVLSGVVSTFKISQDGSSYTEAFHFEGEIFGFEAGAEHSLGAEAVSDCAVAVIRCPAIDVAEASAELMSGGLFAHMAQCLPRALTCTKIDR